MSIITKVFRRPQATKPPTGGSSDLGTTKTVETSNNVEVKDNASKPDDSYQEQSATKVALLLTSVLLSMFLVALDRTIISTVRLHGNKSTSYAQLLPELCTNQF